MAARNNMLLRLFYTFLLLCVLFNGNLFYNGASKEFTAGFMADSQRLMQRKRNNLNYFNFSDHFKREVAGREHKTSTPICKSTMRGFIILALPSSLFFHDLTICMDIHRNPGPVVDDLSTFQRPCCSNDLNIPSTNISYSRQQLFDLRSKSSLQPDLFQFLKVEGILKTHRVRAGKSLNRSSVTYKIKSVFRQRMLRDFTTTTVGPNLNNLVTVKHLLPIQPNYRKLLNFCILNARSINNNSYNQRLCRQEKNRYFSSHRNLA